VCACNSFSRPPPTQQAKISRSFNRM
jgi:hypothetical protein